MSTTQTPMTDALGKSLAGRPNNHGLVPGNAGYESLDAFKERRYREMKEHARRLERDRAELIAALKGALPAMRSYAAMVRRSSGHHSERSAYADKAVSSARALLQRTGG